MDMMDRMDIVDGWTRASAKQDSCQPSAISNQWSAVGGQPADIPHSAFAIPDSSYCVLSMNLW